MDATPSAEDHTRITILVKQIGSRNPQTFNRIIERLNRQHGLQVGDSAQPRIVQANFVTNVANESIKFGEFQIHRRIVGIIGVACRSPSTSESNQNRERSPNEKTMAIRRRSSVGVIVGIDDVKIFYENLKSDFSSTLVDSRCILIGYNEEDCTTRFASREALQFAAMEDADGLEEAIREFVRNIYFVHEQKRMDVAFEKVDPPPCPLLPEEEKLRVGTENKTSKTFRRKCIGRCRKHQADYTLLAGLPSQALEHYQNAIELLKSANDFLWLAGALEGWACAAMALIFEEMNTNRSSMHRVATLTPAQLREAAQGKNYHSLGVNHGHQRYRSDEDASRFSTTNSAERDVERNGSGGRKTALSWIKLDRKDKLDSVTILESFEQAIEHYGKFGFASFLEYECMMKATDLFRLQGRYIEMEEFHRTHVGKFLDDSFTKFDHQFKAQVCANSAEMYRKINFLRKSAFFSRLGVLFRLHVMDGETRTVADYRSVYPILFRTLYGYGINETASRDVTQSSSSQNGPIELQIKALHEVYTSSTRAQLSDAAIRHLCHLLQGYYPFLEPSMRARLISELATLVSTRKHNLSTHLPLEELGLGPSSIILPPIQLTRFPEVCDPEVMSLPSHLAPRVIRASDTTKSHFIYSHFERKAEERRRKHQAVQWVVGAHCLLRIHVYNCLPQELVVRELCVLGEGVTFETVPLRLSLPPSPEKMPQRTSDLQMQHDLIVVPRTPGQLTITGYSCSVFGLKNVCKLRARKSLTIEILPELPLLVVQSSLPKAPISSVDGEVDSAEITIYSGQTFQHSLALINSSDKLGICDVRVQITQPKVNGGPSLIKLANEFDTTNDSLCTPTLESEGFTLAPGEQKPIEFTMFGVDPTATTDDEKSQSLDETRMSDFRPPSPTPSIVSEMSSATFIGDRIPYTGRLLTAQFVFDYTATLEGPSGEHYKRTARLPIAITVVPAITVAAWSILPGDGPFTRYIVVDVSNSTDSDADLVFSGTRAMSVPPRETCRVPLLCPCCTEVAGRAFYAAQQKDSKVMQRLEIERLRRILEAHVAKHLDIRWTISTKNLEGLVPVGALLSSIPLLKQLVLPAISLELIVNGVPYLSQDDLSVGIGDVNVLEIAVISSLDYEFHGEMELECEQEVLLRRKSIPRPHNLVIVGSRKVPFSVPTKGGDDSLLTPKSKIVFRLLFRVEGVYKVRPIVRARREEQQLFADEVFSSPISFNVSTKTR